MKCSRRARKERVEGYNVTLRRLRLHAEVKALEEDREEARREAELYLKNRIPPEIVNVWRFYGREAMKIEDAQRVSDPSDTNQT